MLPFVLISGRPGNVGSGGEAYGQIKNEVEIQTRIRHCRQVARWKGSGALQEQMGP